MSIAAHSANATASFDRRLGTALLLTVLALCTAQAETFKVLHAFNPNNGDGYFPEGGLAIDSHGNVFGTTGDGGLSSCHAQGCGVVFELTPNLDGSWTETLIHKFNGADGDFPAGPVAFDNRGNLYGTAASAGSYQLGTVFELTPAGGGNWTETVLHQFTGGWDGAGNPGAGVAVDRVGNLYGVSATDGLYGNGVLFAMTGATKSTEVALHQFTGGDDGANPGIWLTFDASGNILGTTGSGGADHYYGVVFKLTSNPGRPGWNEDVLYSFTPHDGLTSYSGVVSDAAGNLYGTSSLGGPYGQGAVFQLTQHDGTWSPTVIYSFRGPPDGADPRGPLAIDRAGNLYGATDEGGLFHAGVAFKLAPSGGGQWTETMLHAFTGGADGGVPEDGVFLDSAGNLYGTAQVGGLGGGGGVVFELIP